MLLNLLHRAGWVAFPLGLFSVLLLAIVMERFYALTQFKKLELRAFDSLMVRLTYGSSLPTMDPADADAPIYRILWAASSLPYGPLEARQTAADIALAAERMRLRRYMNLLATIGSISPFIGLFGTVLGVLESFQTMQNAGLGGQQMAGGIGEALSATALGLAVAIPAVMAYNFFAGQVQGMVLDIQGHAAQLVPRLGIAAAPNGNTGGPGNA